MAVDRATLPKSPDRISDLISKIGTGIAQAALGAAGMTPPKGSHTFGLEGLANLVKTHMAESKETQDKAEKLNVSPEEYSSRKELKELQEQIKEVQELQKKIGIGIDFGKEFPKLFEDSSKNIKDGFGEVADAISDQPKKQIEELKKAGFGKKEEGGIGEALFGGGGLAKYRQSAVQLALAGSGLGGIEEVFGISGRIEKVIEQTKERREKSKEEEETAKKLGVSPEEYRQAKETYDIKKERRELHEEAVSLGLRGFSDVAAEIESEKTQKAAAKVSTKPGAALTEDTLKDFVEGVREGVTDGLKEAGIVPGGPGGQGESLAEIADNTQKTHEEIADLHDTMKTRDQSLVQPIVDKLDEQQSSLEEISGNTEGIKQTAEEDKEEKKKEGVGGKGLIGSIISGAVSAIGSAVTSPAGILTIAGILAGMVGYKFGKKAELAKEEREDKEIISEKEKRDKVIADELRKRGMSEEDIKKSLTPGMHLDLREGDIPKTKEDFEKRKKSAGKGLLGKLSDIVVPEVSAAEIPISATGIRTVPATPIPIPSGGIKPGSEAQPQQPVINNFNIQSPPAPITIERESYVRGLQNLSWLPW